MDSRTALKCAMGIIASIGCFIQLQSTLATYFSYSTITRTASQSPKILEIMSLSLCVSYADILDPKYIEHLVPLKILKLSGDERRAAIQDFLTLKQIFDGTPSNESLMSGCAIRSKSPRVLYRPKTIDECHSLIKVKKYYTQEFMCYMFIPKNVSIKYLTYLLSVQLPGEIFVVRLSNSFSKRMNYIKLVVHSDDGMPEYSKRFSGLIHPSNPSKTMYKLKYIRYFVQLLGYPYDLVLCSQVKNIHTNCFVNCIINGTIGTFGRIAYDLDIEYPYSYRHVSVTQVEDMNISMIYDDIYDSCNEKCIYRHCKHDYSITNYYYDKHIQSVIVLEAPTAPNVYTNFVPVQDMLDLFVYVMGALGAWFGFAVYNIDPYSVYRFALAKWHPTNQPPIAVRRQCQCRRCRSYGATGR